MGFAVGHYLPPARGSTRGSYPTTRRQLASGIGFVIVLSIDQWPERKTRAWQ